MPGDAAAGGMRAADCQTSHSAGSAGDAFPRDSRGGAGVQLVVCAVHDERNVVAGTPDYVAVLGCGHCLALFALAAPPASRAHGVPADR